ncbi:hypothetical protein HZB88_03705 [archaeon]|nr:hypothetical protein [archaeon]
MVNFEKKGTSDVDSKAGLPDLIIGMNKGRNGEQRISIRDGDGTEGETPPVDEAVIGAVVEEGNIETLFEGGDEKMEKNKIPEKDTLNLHTFLYNNFIKPWGSPLYKWGTARISSGYKGVERFAKTRYGPSIIIGGVIVILGGTSYWVASYFSTKSAIQQQAQEEKIVPEEQALEGLVGAFNKDTKSKGKEHEALEIQLGEKEGIINKYTNAAKSIETDYEKLKDNVDGKVIERKKTANGKVLEKREGGLRGYAGTVQEKMNCLVVYLKEVVVGHCLDVGKSLEEIEGSMKKESEEFIGEVNKLTETLKGEQPKLKGEQPTYNTSSSTKTK